MKNSVFNALVVPTLASLLGIGMTAVCVAQSNIPSSGLTDLVKPAQGLNLPGAQLARIETLKCPEVITVGGQDITGGWRLTGQQTLLTSAEIRGGNGLFCLYDLKHYGNPVVIWQSITPKYKSCTVSGTTFTCTKS